MPKSNEYTITQLEKRLVTNEITQKVYRVSQIAIVVGGNNKDAEGWVETVAFPHEHPAPQIRFPDNIDLDHAVKFIEVSSRKTLTDKAKTVAGELQVWTAQWAEFKETHCG